MKCCVPDCGYNHGRIRNPQSDITIHSFPKDPKLRAAWLEALALPDLPACRMYICSQHFLEKDLQNTLHGFKRIRVGAVPVTNETRAPADSRICKLCLRLDAKMYQLTNHKLSIMYRDIMGMPPTRGVNNKLPMGICFECASKLQTASAFRCKALICDTLLKEHYLTNQCLTVSDVQTLYRKHPDLKSKLAIKEVFKFNSNDLTDLIPQPFVKIENIPEIEINNLDVNNESQNLNVDVKNEIDILDISDDDSQCVDVDDDDNFDERPKINFFENIIFVKSQNTQVCNTIELKSVESELNFENEKEVDGNMEIVVLEDNASAIEKKKTKKIVTRKVKKNASAIEKKKTKKIARSKVKKTGDEPPKKRGRKKKMPYVRSYLAVDENVFTITNLDPEELKKEILERQHCQRYILSPYKCTVCYKWFPTQDILDRHAFKHSEQCGPLTCTICFVRLKSPGRMQLHMKYQHTNEFSCKLCPLVTRNRNVARGHVKYHAGSKYPCQHCTMEFEKQPSYLSHLRLKHMCDFVCELCGYTFINKKGVTSHKKIKHRFYKDSDELQGPFCSVCDVKFLNKKAYDRHLGLSSKHVKSENDPNWLSNDPTIKSRRIGNIGAQYSRTTIRRRDINQATPSGPFTCEQCGVVLPDYRMYAAHFKHSHPGINKTQFNMANIPYMCDQCGKMFSFATTLASHMWVHTGQKLFQCDHCNKTFTTKGSLTGHMNLHESVKKLYECNICGKQLSFKYNMTRHMLIHTGLKPFKCDICEKSFRTKAEIRPHIDYVHLKKPWPKRVRRRNKKCDQLSLEY